MVATVIKSTTLLIIFLQCCGCAGQLQGFPGGQVPDDRNHLPTPPPKRSSINDYADAIDKQIALPLRNLLDPPRQLRRLTGNPKQALNLNAFDDVPASSWFEHRHPYQRLTHDELYRGPNKIEGPDTSAAMTVIQAKADGVTPGFAVEDARGNRFFLKFDPPGYPELASGAEVVATKLFYAAGYFTPENYIVVFHPDRFVLGENVRFTDSKGRKRSMRREDLTDILQRVEKRSDGKIRALASRYIPGRIIGPFRYQDVVPADSNDFVPHEHRRELRALYVFGSWLNHIDSKDQNSLDSYITDSSGVSYVRHYLIDFGTCLGSGGRGPHPAYRGNEYEIDPGAMLRKILTLGLFPRDYERSDTIPFTSIGRYTANGFNPGDFRSIFPNPAYGNLTLRDAFWGAKLVASFSDDDLRAVVRSGEYSDPDAEAWLLSQMIRRRDIVCSYWFDRTPPLDDFTLEEDENGRQRLFFCNIAVDLGIWEQSGVSYHFEYQACDSDHQGGQILRFTTECPLPDGFAEVGGRVEVRVRKSEQATWSRPVTLMLQGDTSGELSITGLLRPERGR